MTILFWFISLSVLLVSGAFLFSAWVKTPGFQRSWKILANGFKDAWRGAAWTGQRPRYPVDLWVWETMEDEDVCEDCLQRAQMPPMDIADWMKHGIPGTPEAETECGENCRCRLIPYKKNNAFRKQH